MKLDYELTKEDYLAFNLHTISISSTAKRTLLINRFAVPLLYIIILPIIMIKITDMPLWFALGWVVLVDLLWIIYYPKYHKRIISKRTIKLIDEGKNDNMLGKQSISLTDTGILSSNNHSELKTDWKGIQNVLETEEHIYIYVTTLSAFIIPIRFFTDLNHKNEFISTLNYLRFKTS